MVKPFNDTSILDVTQEMVDQGYTVQQMYELSEQFFITLGFEPMTDTFWQLSMITKPEEREVVCHASAEDFFKDEDFRIKMCTAITHADLVTVHHEMGHIVYFMEYSKQPFVYREAANPGFHEAIGDTMALAVNTPAHLQVFYISGSNLTSDTLFISRD
jgi:peptidyl-dipeptidase A